MFIDTTTPINEISKAVHELAVSKGWWENGPHGRNKGELIALMHSELSECLEALRAGNPPDDKVPSLTGEAAELADVCIRLFDYAAAFGIDIAGAIVAKHNFNATRAHKHGGKTF